jgi:hypothetical protein
MKFLISNWRWFFCLLLLGGGLAFSGCASTESDNMSERPWNTPQGWENGLPGGMGNQQRPN